MKLTIKRAIFNDIYFPHLKDYSHRYEVFYGGAGSGKSVFVAQKLILKALTGKRKILVIRKFGTTLRDSVFQLIQDNLSKWGILKYCKVNLTNLQISLPNGSTFLFKGLDDSEKIKSIVDLTDIWCEEATELSQDEYEQLDLRLRAKADGLQMIATFNPVSKANWTYERWFNGSLPDNAVVVKSTYKDNRFLPQAYIDSLEAMVKTNPTYYRIYALGEFCSLDRLVYNNWRAEEFDYRDIDGTLCCGLDFGFVSDPTAFICSIATDDKKLYVFDSWSATGYTNDSIAKQISQMGFGKSSIICDSAEPKSIEELKRCGITRAKEAIKGQGSIMNGIKKLQEYEIIVHPSCGGVIEELQNYAWQKDRRTGEYMEQPADSYNHFMDALRYSIQCVTRNIKPTFYSKAYLGL